MKYKMESRKTIWILNHHATEMAFQHGGRHYYFAKYLIEKGYDVRIFCASVLHNSQEDAVDLQGNISKELIVDGIPFVFVKTRKYRGNGLSRVLGMFDYYFNVKKACKQYPRPDVIIGSSVHPLACVAAIHLSKRYSCKNIVEIRDLWPESIVAYSSKWSRNNPLIKLLYQGEKWIYKHADKIIMTWPGGYDYIINKGWGKVISKDKVVHVSNGVDIESFNFYIKKYPFKDSDLDSSHKKFVYTGSIRKVNNLEMLISAAEKIQNEDVLLLIFGDGDEKTRLQEIVETKKLKNILFKGRVEKKYIPSILSQCDVSILHNSSTELDRYGQSQNKFFEYLASGHPILMTYSVGHSIVNKRHCGIELREQSSETIAAAINQFCDLSSDMYQAYSNQAIEVARSYDYRCLTENLVCIIEGL